VHTRSKKANTIPRITVHRTSNTISTPNTPHFPFDFDVFLAFAFFSILFSLLDLKSETAFAVLEPFETLTERKVLDEVSGEVDFVAFDFSEFEDPEDCEADRVRLPRFVSSPGFNFPSFSSRSSLRA
jgi:hypothetical protein